MPVGNRTIDVSTLLEPDEFAIQITNRFREWEIYRNNWLTQKREIRNYLFAIDTGQTSNSILPWKNSTHIPKLTQIRDNLHANYMAALFPNDRPIVWEGDDEDSEAKDKRLTIEAYMENKMRQGGFRTEVSKCVSDFIDYGNCFATVEFVAEKTVDQTTGEEIPGYVGPKLVRISPLDVTFNPTASDFRTTPKIIRSMKTLGSLKAEIEDHPECGYLAKVFDMVVANRQKFSGFSLGDFAKIEAYQFDGFSSYFQYFTSDYVELLDFYGDVYDYTTGKFYKNYCITVVDRCKIIRMEPNPSWLGADVIHHAGWRLRPDNLYAMGPLDNLVGMQYRIDHLENAKADAFDLIIHPVIKVKGLVEDFNYGPGERIFIGDDGDVEFQAPDTTCLNADTQIAMYEQKMEEMAGAPKQAMGFRTPGEKTAYEVQVLENGANRVFINKTSYFEEIFLEPSLNNMLECSRRNMGLSDVVRTMDDQYGVVMFTKITKEDITANGKIRPVGARHFARNANIIQNLTQWTNSAIGQDPSVNVHMSGKRLAYLFEELMGLERYHLVQDNIRVAESLQTEQLKQSAMQVLQEQAGSAGTPPGSGQPPQDAGATGPQQAPNGQPTSLPDNYKGPTPNQYAFLGPRTHIGAVPPGATTSRINSVR